MIDIEMKRFAIGPEVLAGATRGRKDFAKLIADTAGASTGEIIVLNFKGIRYATSSYLREAIVNFRNVCRDSRRDLVVLLTNLAPEVKEELDYLLKNINDAMPVQSSGSRDITLLGVLDGRHLRAFEAVTSTNGATAAELRQHYADEDVTRNAWNNVLSQLSAKGLVTETKAGKEKRYLPIRSR